MLKYKIISKDQNSTAEYFGDASMMEQIVKWLEPQFFGFPERWVPHKDEGGVYDDADVLDERMVEVSPAVAEVVNDANEVVQEAIPAVMKKEVKLKAEYSVEIVDISAQVALENCMAARKAEYPTAEEFLNAFFDGGEAALTALQAKRLLVKQRHPKP
jgi:hypothetical protein